MGATGKRLQRDYSWAVKALPVKCFRLGIIHKTQTHELLQKGLCYLKVVNMIEQVEIDISARTVAQVIREADKCQPEGAYIECKGEKVSLFF